MSGLFKHQERDASAIWGAYFRYADGLYSDSGKTIWIIPIRRVLKLYLIKVDNTDGWPDKICIQCVHQVSRCHAFKTRVVKSDSQLRQYIKGLTVIVEEPLQQKISINHSALQPHQRAPTIFHPLNLNDQLNRQVQVG